MRLVVSTMLLFCMATHAQNVQFELAKSINFVSTLLSPIKNGWAGGLNCPQIYSLDVNFDGKDDLVLFDKSSVRNTVFINSNNTWSYAPEYTLLLPKIDVFLTIVDYNCDGLKDIFTGNSNSEIVMYKNISSHGVLKWAKVTNGIHATGKFGLKYNINPGIYDKPAVLDIDDDGDIDILLYDTNAGSGVVLNKNLSIETYNVCDSLVFEKYISCWGKFEISHDCNTQIGLNTSCPNYGGTQDARIMHNGVGISVLDVDSNGVNDLFVSHIECNKISLLSNTGTNLMANITSVIENYPSSSPINIRKFPNLYYLDANFDGKNDLLASPSLPPDEIIYGQNFNQSVWIYQNTGTNTSPNFNLWKTNFLQDEMIDLGAQAYPALADLDADGDLDLVVGFKGLSSGSFFYSSLHLYENKGTKDSALFMLTSGDYLSLSTLSGSSICPGFADMNSDGALDLYFTIQIPGQGSSIKYMLNKNTSAQPANFNSPIQTLPVTLYDGDKVNIFDINKDNKPDILLASNLLGNLTYYKNTGTISNLSFSAESTNFLGYDYNFSRKGMAIHCTNLHSADTMQIIVFENNKPLYIYSSPHKANYTFGSGDSTFTYNSISKYFDVLNLGYYASITTADLNNDGKKEIIIGTDAGGLMLMHNIRRNPITVIPKPNDLSAPKVKEKNISVIPNPTYDNHFTIKHLHPITATFFDIYGKPVPIMVTATSLHETTYRVINFNGLLFGIIYQAGAATVTKIMVY